MELSSIELHVFVSLTVILGTGLVALLVDYLKGNNEQLREYNVELRVRREEENRRSLTEIRLLREQMIANSNLITHIDQPGASETKPPRCGRSRRRSSSPWRRRRRPLRCNQRSSNTPSRGPCATPPPRNR